MPRTTDPERHRSDRIGWLRAAVFGANDGIVLAASLVVGVAAAHAEPGNVLLNGVAGMGRWRDVNRACRRSGLPGGSQGAPRCGPRPGELRKSVGPAWGLGRC